jgi:hypothetical protein
MAENRPIRQEFTVSGPPRPQVVEAIAPVPTAGATPATVGVPAGANRAPLLPAILVSSSGANIAAPLLPAVIGGPPAPTGAPVKVVTGKGA